MPQENSKWIDEWKNIWIVKLKIIGMYESRIIPIVYNEEMGEGLWDDGRGLVLVSR